MPSCNWAFGCAIGLFVITLIIVLVIVLGGMDNGDEKIVVIPGGGGAPPASVSAPAKGARMEQGGIKELHSAAEAVRLLKSKEPCVVLFYANFCGHCKQMMPDFEQAAKEASSRLGIVIARVESGQLKDMASVSSQLPAVTGFPTMMTNFEGSGELKAHVGRKDRAYMRGLLEGSRNRASKNVALRSSCGGSQLRAEAMGDAADDDDKKKPDDKKKKKRKMVEYKNFDDVCADLQGKKKVIVMAYADWCGYCKKMKPDYEALIDKAPEDVKIGRINDNNIHMAESCVGDNGVIDVLRAYPTILYSDGSKIQKIMGAQSLDTLLKLVS